MSQRGEDGDKVGGDRGRGEENQDASLQGSAVECDNAVGLSSQTVIDPILDQFNKQQSSDTSAHDGEITPGEELFDIIKSRESEVDKLSKIKKLFEKEPKPDINLQGTYNDTPLHMAVSKKDIKVVEWLVNNGAKIDIKNSRGRTSLDIAKSLKRKDIVNILAPNEQNYPQPGSSSYVGRFNIRPHSTDDIEDKVNERLEEFVKYFVKEFEAKLHTYHMILEGEGKNAVEFSDTFLRNTGKVTGGAIGGGIGLLLAGLATFTKAAKVGAELGSVIVGTFAGKLEERNQRKEVISLAKLVYHCKRNKADVRRILVEAGYDIFQSFEMQFMSVTTDQGYEGALRKLAEDATNRAISYYKKKEDAAISEGVILGESKIKLTFGIPIFKRHGFKIYYQSSNKKWNSASLYEDVGLVMEAEPPKETNIYYEKKDGKSRSDKYGFRRPLSFELERWEILIEEYEKIDNTTKSSQFTGYQYILDTNSSTNVKCIVEKINREDKGLEEERTKEIIREYKDEIIEEINALEKQSHGFEEDRKILGEKKTYVKNLKVDELYNSIEEGKKENRENFQKILQALEEKRMDEAALSKKPIWYEIRPTLTSFTALSPGRQDTLNQVASSIQDGVIVISGLDGVGKTELAIKYAHDHSTDYKGNVIWMNAETQHILQESFLKLAKELKISIKDNDDEERSTKSIIKDVYEYFAEGKSLFIFDNAEKFALVENILPFALPPNTNKPDVLITSPNKLEWEIARGNRKVLLPVGDFTDIEAIEFVKEVLDIKNDSQQQAIIKLVKQLHNFPLALQQAVAYIKERNEAYQKRNFEFKVCDYVKKYEVAPKQLLNVQMPTDMHAETIFKTLEITLDKIKNEEYGQTSLNMLNIISYFASSDIPENMFFSELTSGDQDKLFSVTKLLEKYSIVRLEDGMLNVHGLIQQVRRLELEEEKVEEETLATALKLLKEHMKDRNSIGLYKSHVTSAWNYARKYDKLIETFIVNDIQDEAAFTTNFHLIAEGSSYEIVESIINKVEQNYSNKIKEVLNAIDKDRGVPLHNAAMSGNEEIVKLLIEKGRNVNVRKEHSWTPLHLAAKNGHLEVARVLLDKKAKVNNKTGYKFTSLHLAARNGCLDIVKLLLDSDADVNAQDRNDFTPLHFAVKENHFDVVQALLKDNAININAETKYKCTPLNFAAKDGFINTVKDLLEKGANVNMEDTGRFTPLHLAAFNNHKEVVNELLKGSEIDINTKTTNGNTPLHLAAEKGNLEVVKALIARDADVHISNEEGKVASDLAHEKNYMEVKNYIMQNYHNRGIYYM